MNAAASGFLLVSNPAVALDPRIIAQFRSLLLVVACIAAGAAVSFALRALLGPRFRPLRWLSRVPRNSLLAMALLMAVSLGGRFVDWHWRGVPTVQLLDEFSYVLEAQTFVHGRLTNPTPEFWTHFETYHQLLWPSYMGKHPPGQSLFLALGWAVFGLPFAGVLLSCALMCAALYWALLGIMPGRWAFLGGLIAAAQITWTTNWNDSYWGGAVAALGACLLVGAALRLRKQISVHNGAILALGCWLLAVSRPYEGTLLAAPVGIAVLVRFVAQFRSGQRLPAVKAVAAFVLVLGAGAAWLGYYNWRGTGHIGDLPWAEHWRQYSVTPALLFQKPATPSNRFEAQYTGSNPEIAAQKNRYIAIEHPYRWRMRTLSGWLLSISTKFVLIWSFFVGGALTPLVAGLLLCAGNRKLRWLWPPLAIMALGFSFETWSHEHYFAPILPVVAIIGLFALRSVYAWHRRTRLGAAVVLASLLAIVCVQALQYANIPPFAERATNPITISKGAVENALNAIPGNSLVLVRYTTDHVAREEWVRNGYDIPSQRIIWAHSLDPVDPDQPLICHYRDRHVWRLTPPDHDELWSVEQARQALKPVDTNELCSAGNSSALLSTASQSK
jgi:hypothetical protein